MTTEQKLTAIRAKCVELLAIADERPEGVWKSSDEGWSVLSHGDLVCEECLTESAAFIASCAGPAEAGWRSTIAAIDDILTYWGLHKDTEIVREILTAWEGIL